MDKDVKRLVLKLVAIALIAVACFTFPGMSWQHVLLLAAQIVVAFI